MKKPTILFISTEDISGTLVLRQSIVASLYRHYQKAVIDGTAQPITGEILVVVGSETFLKKFTEKYGQDTTIIEMMAVVNGTSLGGYKKPISLAQYVTGTLEISAETSAKVRKEMQVIPVLQEGFVNESWGMKELIAAMLTAQSTFITIDADEFSIADTVTGEILDSLPVREEEGFRAVVTDQVLPSRTAAIAWVNEKQVAILSRTTPSTWGSEENQVILPTDQVVIAKSIVPIGTEGYGTTSFFKDAVFTQLATAYRNAVISGTVKKTTTAGVLEDANA